MDVVLGAWTTPDDNKPSAKILRRGLMFPRESQVAQSASGNAPTRNRELAETLHCVQVCRLR